MSKAFWAVGTLIIMMIIGILLMGSTEGAKGRTDCELESKKVGKRTVKVWDCE